MVEPARRGEVGVLYNRSLLTLDVHCWCTIVTSVDELPSLCVWVGAGPVLPGS